MRKQTIKDNCDTHRILPVSSLYGISRSLVGSVFDTLCYHCTQHMDGIMGFLFSSLFLGAFPRFFLPFLLVFIGSF